MIDCLAVALNRILNTVIILSLVPWLYHWISLLHPLCLNNIARYDHCAVVWSWLSHDAICMSLSDFGNCIFELNKVNSWVRHSNLVSSKEPLHFVRLRVLLCICKIALAWAFLVKSSSMLIINIGSLISLKSTLGNSFGLSLFTLAYLILISWWANCVIDCVLSRWGPSRQSLK